MVAIQVGQAAIKYFVGGGDAAGNPLAPVPVSTDGSAGPGAGAAPSASGRVQAPQVPNLLPLWESGTVFDAHLYVTGTGHLHIDTTSSIFPHTSYQQLKLGDWSWAHEWNTEVVLPRSVQRNGTLFLDTFLVRNGSPIDPRQPGFSAEDVYHNRQPLMKYEKQKRIRAERSLLGSSGGDGNKQVVLEETVEEAKAMDNAMPIIPYYHPNITLAVIGNAGAIPQAQLTPVVARYIDSISPAEGTLNPRFYPIVFPNKFWQLKSQSFPVNETVPSVKLNVKLEPMGMQKFQIFATMDESFSQAANNPMGGGAGASEFDEVKRVLLETNIFLLATTIIVTALHSIFELLAFKNDVTHWRNRKDQTGVSIRTILTNVVVQLIITLYLFDNNQDTSFMILFGQGTGLLIEAWKITKAVDISFVRATSGILPVKLFIKDKHVLSAQEKATKEYDALAFKYVTWGTTPLLIGYTIYSLMYEHHRGWYSFVISTLTSFVYMFGFVQLIPQLIINWKLKSVAHMPVRSLTYKFLNTIVDDFFSFVIKMPLLHRLACFRDDVVFIILLYQMYIYKVDPNRENEYGQVLDEKTTHPETSEKAKEDAKARAIEETKKDK